MTNTVMATPLGNRVAAIKNLTTILHFRLVSKFSSVSKRRESRREKRELRERKRLAL